MLFLVVINYHGELIKNCFHVRLIEILNPLIFIFEMNFSRLNFSEKYASSIRIYANCHLKAAQATILEILWESHQTEKTKETLKEREKSRDFDVTNRRSEKVL